MAQNAFYVLDADTHAALAKPDGLSPETDNAPDGLNHTSSLSHPPFGFATHSLNAASSSRNNNRSSHQRSRSLLPLYFDPDANVGGLVCGLQENTKNLILANILHSSLISTDSQPPADVICFTAQNGSRNIVSAVGSLPESISRETQIIILTPPRNVSKMRAEHHGSPRTSVYPLLIHEEDIQIEHLVHLVAGESLDSVTTPVPEVYSNFRAAEAKFRYSEAIQGVSLAGQEDLVEHISRPLAKRGQKNPPPLPEWVAWLKEGQKASVPASTWASSQTTSEATNQRSHLVLCIDWTGLFPQEQRLISVLGDMVLNYWLKHCQVKGRAGTAIRTVVVCDQAHEYLHNASPGPFIRKLLQLVSPSSSTFSTVLQKNVADSPSDISKNQETLNSNLILLAETPIRLPANLLDHLSFLVIHRFTSPSWLKSIEEHFFLPFSREGREGAAQYSASQEATENSSSTMLQVIGLEPNEVMVFAPRGSKSNARTSAGMVRINNVTHNPTATATVNAATSSTSPNITVNTNNSDVIKRGLGHQWVKIKLSNGQDVYDVNGTPVSTPRDIAFPSSATSSGSMSSTGGFNINMDPILNASVLRRGPSPNPNSFNAMPPKSSHTAFASHASAPNASPQRPWGLSALASTTGSSNSINMPTPITTSLLSPIDGSTRVSGSSLLHSTPSAGATALPTRLSPPSPGPRSISTGPNSGSIAYPGQYALNPSSPVGTSGGGFSPFIAPRHFSSASGGGGESIFSSSYPGIGGGGGGHAGMGLPSSYVEVRPLSTHSTNVNHDAGGFGFNGMSRPSYRDATIPSTSRDGEVTMQRRDTAVPGVGYAHSDIGTPGASGTSSTSSVPGVPHSEGLGLGPSSPLGSGPSPVYPESFFWPLLDALERARAQVSTPHNRAQSVRHSVVGQELPQAARQRLQLTFKEYVAAAARSGVIVTGDAGDKAWIALKEWKYPGKNTGSHSGRINLR